MSPALSGVKRRLLRQWNICSVTCCHALGDKIFFAVVNSHRITYYPVSSPGQIRFGQEGAGLPGQQVFYGRNNIDNAARSVRVRRGSKNSVGEREYGAAVGDGHAIEVIRRQRHTGASVARRSFLDGYS